MSKCDSQRIKTIINLQEPGEHANCGNQLCSSGFSYEPSIFMDNDIFFYNFQWKDYSPGHQPLLLDMVKVMSFSLTEGKVRSITVMKQWLEISRSRVGSKQAKIMTLFRLQFTVTRVSVGQEFSSLPFSSSTGDSNLRMPSVSFEPRGLFFSIFEALNPALVFNENLFRTALQTVFRSNEKPNRKCL